MAKSRILVGSKESSVQTGLFTFEHMDPVHWSSISTECQIPVGFMFLAGVAKYPRNHSNTRFRAGKDRIFIQSFYPHSSEGTYRTRGFGALYSLYEPAHLEADDIVLDSSAIYQALPDNKIRLVLANGENRDGECIREMFNEICQQKGINDFSPIDSYPALYQVTFKKKSCGYFLKDRTYIVWARPIGLPDQQSGEIFKGWLFCDINCGLPAIMKADREEFVKLDVQDGQEVGLFKLFGHKLIFNEALL